MRRSSLLLREKVVTQPLQLQQAQTQAQLTRILATLEEVPRLAGAVERLDKESDILLNKLEVTKK